MKNKIVSIVLLFLLSTVAFAQTKDKPVSLGLPGDDLDLYAVLDVFQKSKTIEDFEKSLNEEKGPNNLDLDQDKKVDFIKVVTNKDGDSFTFVLQVAVSKTENQDVAVIFVSKDSKGGVSIQAVGDEDLYGKDYVVEPKSASASGGTANPGYTGEGSSETMNIPASTSPTTTVVVQQAPIVQYVYSPAYVPYYPPYYYGYYPPYYRPFVPIARAVYWSNHYPCHGAYYGGYHGSVNINVNNVNHYNNYNNNSRKTSNTVNNNKANGSYGNRATTGNNSNAKNSASTRPTAGNSASTRPSTGKSASTRPSTGNSATTRPASSSKSASTRQSSSSASTRPSTSNRSSGSSSSYSRPSTSSSRSSYSGGGGRSGGRSYSGGGGMRGGGRR